MPSEIQGHLQSAVDNSDGLHFIILIPSGAYQEAFPAGRPQAANRQAIDALIRLQGLDALGHTWQRQLELWRDMAASVSHFFERCRRIQPLEADGAPSTLNRAVIDVEIGGLFYAAIVGFGGVFAATLDQQRVTSGVAEKRFVMAASRIERALNKRYLLQA